MNSVWQTGDLLVSGTPPAAAPPVVKFGGSLFSRPSWADDLRSLLAERTGGGLIVVGGGPLADGLRAIDATSRQSNQLMHALAIASMGITARLVAVALGLPRIADPDELGALGKLGSFATGPAAVLDPVRWFAACPQHRGLPQGWQVTSDSIAAVAAARAGGGLLLAKSVPPPHAGLQALAAAGWIDGHFPAVAAAAGRITWAARVSPTPPGPPAAAR